MWMPIQLSRRQSGDMDRVGGLWLGFPWPKGLDLGSPVSKVHPMRDATIAETAVAESIVLPACRLYNPGNVGGRSPELVPVRVQVAWLMPPERAIQQCMKVLMIGSRWVGATMPHNATATLTWADVDKVRPI